MQEANRMAERAAEMSAKAKETIQESEKNGCDRNHSGKAVTTEGGYPILNPENESNKK
jgi:hypothetical protein